MVDVGNVARDDVEDDRNGRRRWGGRGDDVAAFERASARAGEDDDGARTGCVGARRARRVGGANDERVSGDAGSRGLGSVAFVAVESE